MDDLNERVAVLESVCARIEKDTTRLFEMLREHMEKEEKDREEDRRYRRQEMDRLEKMIQSIHIAHEGQTKFIGGVIFAVSALWGVGITLFELFRK